MDLGLVSSSWQPQEVTSILGQSWSSVPDSWSGEVVWVSTGPLHSWTGVRESGENSGKPSRGNPGKRTGSCSLDSQAAVAEELADDGWISHSRCVPQVVVILSNLPKHPPHDFP